MAIGLATGIGLGLQGVSMLTNFVQGLQQKKQLRREEEIKAEQERKFQEIQNSGRAQNLLSMFPTTGIAKSNYYGMLGTDIGLGQPKATSGGQLIPTGGGGMEVDGNDHEEGGVEVTNGMGNEPIAEVEDDEFIYQGMVFSKRIADPQTGVPFSVQAKQLVGLKTREEHGLKKDGNKIAEIEQQIQALFETQNQIKEQIEQGGEEGQGEMNPQPVEEIEQNTMKYGGKLPKYVLGNSSVDLYQRNRYFMLEDENHSLKPIPPKVEVQPIKVPIVNPNIYNTGIKKVNDFAINYNSIPKDNTPFDDTVIKPIDIAKEKKGVDTGSLIDMGIRVTDNIANYFLNRKRKNVDPMRMTKAPVLNTNVNINPQLAAIDEQQAIFGENVRRNATGLSGATAAILGADASMVGEKNKLYGDKDNMERELKNKQLEMNYQNELQNNQIDYQNKLTDTQFYNLKNVTEVSRNITDLTQDIVSGTLDKRKAATDNLKVMLGLGQLDGNSAALQTVSSYAKYLPTELKQQLKTKIKSTNDSVVIEQWNKDNPNDKIE